MDKVSMSYVFSFLRYQTKCVSSSYLDSWWRHKLLDLSSINLKSNGWQGEKEGKMEIQKFKYLENEKSFLDEIKSIFHSFWRAIIWWEIKILYKIADTSFNRNVKYIMQCNTIGPCSSFTSSCSHKNRCLIQVLVWIS